MALTSEGFVLAISFIDTGANVTVRRYPMTAADYATASTDAASAIALWEAVTDAEITSYRVEEVFTEDSVVLPAAAEIENQALITTGIVGEPLKSATLTIPAPDVGIFTSTSGEGFNIVDVSDAAYIAWLAMFSTGGLFTISDGEVAGGSTKGRRIHRKSRRG